MATALVLQVLEAEPIVSHWRSRFDPSAAAGMPAHLTLIFPFKPFERIDEPVETALANIFSETKRFDLCFGSTSRFTAVLWLAPNDPAPVVALVRTLIAAFPDCPPYGAYPEIVPHLTVADLNRDQDDHVAIDEIARAFEKEATVRLPVIARVDAASLFNDERGRWRMVRRFAFQK